jgi:two-component system sensor histidine kinase QseC
MTHSIRKFLLINLLLAMTVIISFTAIGNYFMDKQDIEDHLDNLLEQAGLSFTAIASRDIQHQNWQKLQARMDAVPAQAQKYMSAINNKNDSQSNIGKYRFQISDPHNTLLLHSANAPANMLSDGKFGFHDLTLNGIRYRVFSNYDTETNLTFVVAEPYVERDHLAHQIMTDDLYIMLLTYPLAGFLIWIIIGRGLKSLNQIAAALTQRAPTYLEPVNLLSIPIEIQPLIQELNRLLHRLKEAFDREKRFAGDAAHELRTPLAAIRTQAQVALLVATSQEQSIIVQKVILGVDRANHIVNQLLAMSRLAPENEQMNNIEKCNFNTIVQEVIAQLSAMAHEKNIQLKFKETKENIMINGNSAALHILVRNVIDNAIRYTPEQSQVKIRLEVAKENVSFVVADNGPGIPAEFRERIFERFFRVLGTQSPGSGLGLSIVKQIADLHKATIQMAETDTTNKHGLTMIITFRLHDKK